MEGKELLEYVKKVFEMESAIRIQEEVLKNIGVFIVWIILSIILLFIFLFGGVDVGMEGIFISGIISFIVVGGYMFFKSLSAKASYNDECCKTKEYNDLVKTLTDKDNEEIKRKNEEIIEWNNKHCQEIEAKKAALDIYRAKLEDILKETKNTLEAYYRKDIIYPKYRIFSLCDYLQSGNGI